MLTSGSLSEPSLQAFAHAVLSSWDSSLLLSSCLDQLSSSLGSQLRLSFLLGGFLDRVSLSEVLLL